MIHNNYVSVSQYTVVPLLLLYVMFQQSLINISVILSPITYTFQIDCSLFGETDLSIIL